MIQVYLAAPIGQASRAAKVALWLRQLGFATCSHWHDLCTDQDPHDQATRELLLARNIGDLRGAHILLAMTDRGTPRATLVEIGWALAIGLPVVWLHAEDGTGRNLFDASPMVRRIQLLEDAPEALQESMSKLAFRESDTIPAPADDAFELGGEA